MGRTSWAEVLGGLPLNFVPIFVLDVSLLRANFFQILILVVALKVCYVFIMYK
jgi:hypothetical protein